MRAIDIQPARVITIFQTSILQQHINSTAGFALAALNYDGRLRYYLMQLEFQPVDLQLTMVRGHIRDENFFRGRWQRLLIQTLTSHMNSIEPNQLFILNRAGKLLKKLSLPDLSMPSLVPQEFSILSNADETRAILIPLNNEVPSIWTAGNFQFEFTLHRIRYAQENPDEHAIYHREETIGLTW